MRRPLKFQCPLYHVNFEVCHAWPAEEFKNYMHREFGERPKLEHLEGMTLQYEHKGANVIVMWSKSRQGALHELVHMATLTLKNAGIYVTLEEDEALAYYIQYLGKMVLKL